MAIGMLLIFMQLETASLGFPDLLEAKRITINATNIA
jgi:hypothetical protein